MTNDHNTPSAVAMLSSEGDAYERLHLEDLTSVAPPHTHAGSAYDEALSES